MRSKSQLQVVTNMRVLLLVAAWVALGHQALALDLSQVNRAIQRGRYGEVASELERLSGSASAAELETIRKIQRGLSNYRQSRERGSELEESSSQLSYRRPPQPETPFTPRPAAPPPPASPPNRIIALGGYGTRWSAATVNAAQTPYADQMFKFSPDWPAETIEEYKKAGFVITDVSGGDRLSWAVVMSRYNDRATPRQQIYGPGPMDDRVQTWLANSMKAGYHISDVAGMGNHWVIVITSGLAWGKQRFTLPGPYKYDWVQARLNEGYQVTSAAGGRIVYPDDSVMETYMIVATQDTGWGAVNGWGQASRDQFNDWFKTQRDSGTPTAFIGLHNLPGAYFATGHPFGKGCGYILGAKPEEFMQWVEKQRIFEKVAEVPGPRTIDEILSGK